MTIERKAGRKITGVVVSTKMSKTAIIEVERRLRHPRYNKFVKRRAKYFVHDEADTLGVGDKIVAVESAKKSKNKAWKLSTIVERGRG